MSCQFKTIANIADLENVKNLLFNSSHSVAESACGSTDANDPWNWGSDENEGKKQKSNNDDNKWINDCHISMSPTGELLVIAHKRTMVILVSKWDSNEESSAKTKYHVWWSGEPWQEPNEHITSVLCLPLAASQSRTTAHCGPDWTAIVVGYSSGALRFYTETSSLLFSEVLHEEAVTGIKCQSFQAARHSGGSEQSEELHVVYRNVVCCVFGFALCNTLRACRNQLARVQANCSDRSTSLVAPPLSIRKFSLPEQGTVSDLCVGPMQCPTGFAHLSTASICGGYNAWYRPTPPQSSLVLATGSKPFVGFHYLIEGNSAPVLTDVAKAMATKLKSAIGQAVPGWLMGGRKSAAQQEKVKDPVEPAEPMTCRFGLCDLWRQGDTIVLSPNRKLSVVSDTLGRVILVDNTSGIALRMWKGYRDAECGWIMCHEEKKSNGKRTALFLVIYTPKKGVVEVWAMQQGPRVAVFPASKTGRLLYVSHNLLGVSSNSSSKVNRNPSSCMFIDHNGIFKEITVPFHCALSDKNSKRARDVLLLKKLKACLRDEECLFEVINICKELQTTEIKLHALDLISASRYTTADLIFDVINLFAVCLGSTTKGGGEDVVDSEVISLTEKCDQLEHLVRFYSFLSGLRQKPPDYDTIVSCSSAAENAQKLCEIIQTTPEEVERVLSVVKRKRTESNLRNVKFKDNAANLSSFILGFQKSADSKEIILNKNISSDKLLSISSMVCQGYLDGNCSVADWQNASCESGISPFDILFLAITFWLNKQSISESFALEMLRFSELVRALGCLIAGYKNAECWSQVRLMLRDGEYPVAALTAALVCRSVASSIDSFLPVQPGVNVETENDEEEDEEGDGDNNGNKNGQSPPSRVGEPNASGSKPDNDAMSNSASDIIMDWENISQDTCHWSQLISQLEDVALLYSVLSDKVAHKDNKEAQNLSVLDYKKPEISLGLILSKGKGSIPEMVAKWISSSGLDPLLLLENNSLENVNANSPSSFEKKPSIASVGVTEGIVEQLENSVEAQPTSELHNKMIEDLSMLRSHFPYSLASSSLLANLTWEYILAWNRDLDSLTNLLSAINCIKVINDPHLKQGLCTMIWSTHLRSRFEAALRLINKVGKVAKERLCRQDVGLSDLQIADFFSFCSDFIDIYMESNVLSEIQEKVPARSESIWENCSPIPSLSQLALGQPKANYDLLHLLSQAARAMLLLSTFGLRTHRPLASFFDSVGQGALFSDIWSRPQLPGHSHDAKLMESRTKFLLRAVSASMGTIVSHQQLEWDTKQAILWMTQCLSLASDWSVPVDALRRQQACQLYVKGLDRLAEEVIPAVMDNGLLGSQLLVIVGQRINKTLLSCSNKELKRKITNLSPALTSWINELGEGDSIESVSISETAHLAVVTLSLLPEDHPERHLARQLVDSLKPIAESVSATSNSNNPSNSDNRLTTLSNAYVK